MTNVYVLILVLVEDGLGVSPGFSGEDGEVVLILVLVEDGLGGFVRPAISSEGVLVLILVLVEDGLGGSSCNLA